MPQLNENTSSNIHFFLDRTTATHPIEHHLVVRNTHHAAEANQSVSSPNEETFQAPREMAFPCTSSIRKISPTPITLVSRSLAVPLWGERQVRLGSVKPGPPGVSATRPLRGRKQNSERHSAMSQSCQK